MDRQSSESSPTSSLDVDEALEDGRCRYGERGDAVEGRALLAIHDTVKRFLNEDRMSMADTNTMDRGNSAEGFLRSETTDPAQEIGERGVTQRKPGDLGRHQALVNGMKMARNDSYILTLSYMYACI